MEWKEAPTDEPQAPKSAASIFLEEQAARFASSKMGAGKKKKSREDMTMELLAKFKTKLVKSSDSDNDSLEKTKIEDEKAGGSAVTDSGDAKSDGDEGWLSHKLEDQTGFVFPASTGVLSLLCPSVRVV